MNKLYTISLEEQRQRETKENELKMDNLQQIKILETENNLL